MPRCSNEEEVRKSWLKHLENELGISFHAERGRSDASHNQVVIEFKKKGLFRGSVDSSTFKKAIYDQLSRYITQQASRDDIPREDYIGIAVDGEHIAFAFFKNQAISHRNLLPFNSASVSLVAQACRDSVRRAVTADNLIEDFGHDSNVGRSLISALTREIEQQLKSPGNNKVKMLFEEWQSLFGQVADLSSDQARKLHRQLNLRNLPETQDEKKHIAGMLYVIHTYNAFLMKLLAAEIVSEYGLTAHADYCEHLLSQEDNELLNCLYREIEEGAFFADARIRGFVEEAVFSWYAEGNLTSSGKKEIVQGIRGLLIQLALYRMDDLDAARSRDLLKAFYQSLVPEVLRKALGEFYTPNWLVDVTCDRAEVDDWLAARMLDPTCGSGSFLLEVVRRKREIAARRSLSSQETLNCILDTVWGFDLNPLAVQAARVNFLISIADLVAETKSDIELPVLFADAVYSPAHAASSSPELIEYQIGSDQSDLTLTLPRALVHDRIRLDHVFEAMSEGLMNTDEYDAVENLLISRNSLSSTDAENWKPALEGTYNQVLALHKKSWNGIWFRIVRNFFWSAVAGEFDVILGNPPWVRWSNLPERYRERIKATCEQYAIFSDTPYHGGNELDISAMLTYTVGDKWLKIGGSLVFVITQTLFQSPSSQGFRNFRINDKTRFVPVAVDDLKEIKPFPKINNKTAILRLDKTGEDHQPSYPLDYRVWRSKPGNSTAIQEILSKQDVLDRVDILHHEAQPVEGGNSPWAITPPGRFEELAAIRGACSWLKGRKGITVDINGIYYVRIVDVDEHRKLTRVETRPEAGKKDIGAARRFWVEPDLLYPLLKGAADFSACALHPQEQLYALVPNEGISRQANQAAESRVNSLRHTRKFFSHYRDLLEQRSTWRLRQSKYPYYVIYNVGDYTFAPCKVIWAEMSRSFKSAVITKQDVPLLGKRVVIPDHKIYYADFHDKDTAYYVCGLLNSRLVGEYVSSHTIQIQVSNIFKHLNLPEFAASNKDHLALSRLCKSGHSTRSASQREARLKEMSQLAQQILTT